MMNKTQKNILAVLSLLLTQQANAQDIKPNGSFTITGSINSKLDATLAVVSYKKGSLEISDSVLIKGGHFDYRGNTIGPALVRVAVFYADAGKKKVNDYITVYVDGTEVKLQSADSIKHATVSGSPIHNDYLVYRNLVARQFSQTSIINSRWTKASKEKKENTFFKDSIAAARIAAEEEKKTRLKEYIQKHPDSYFSLSALKELAGSRIDVSIYEPMFLGLSEKVRGTPAGIEFASRLEKTRLTAIGSLAPDFTLNSSEGKPVSLSEFRGKYTLLIFWASWCGPCRRETPNVVKVHHQFKDKNFDILSVSLDKPGARDAWLEAIQKDGMTWTHVSDLNSWDNAAAKTFGVLAIPQNYLLDPEGRIIASNLRGAALEKKLREVL